MCFGPPGNRFQPSKKTTDKPTIKPAAKTDAPGFTNLRELASRKAYEIAMDYKPPTASTSMDFAPATTSTPPKSPITSSWPRQLDTAIWKQADNLTLATKPPVLETAEAVAPNRPPRRGLGKIKTGEEDLKDFTVADGFAVNLFASSDDFPELINPLQMQFDARGRLWVTCFESYPVPLPGALSDDKILIFEDTDGDGKADRRTVFADNLKLPDGFVFHRDGIVASVARKLVWLRDTDGDDIADKREELLRGADDTDTHHGGYLSRTPQGEIILNEALFHRGQFETPHGPLRTKNATALYFNPVTQALRIQRQTSHPNPWKVTWNSKGEAIQMFGGGQIIDCDLYDVSTPVGTASSGSMGMPFRDAKGCAIAVVTGSHFSEDWRDGLVTGHLLGKNTIHYTPIDYKDGTYIKTDNATVLLNSSNPSFRPVDLEFGLDGALYVSDFYYPIIGHAQHSIRDKNRDYSNGRIWRLTRTDAAPSTPPHITGAGIKTLFGHLTHPHVRVRQLARLELENTTTPRFSQRPRKHLGRSTESPRFGIELLWQLERLNAPEGADLFKQLLKSDDLTVRRAAIKSMRTWAPTLGEEANVLASAIATSGDPALKILGTKAPPHPKRKRPTAKRNPPKSQGPSGKRNGKQNKASRSYYNFRGSLAARWRNPSHPPCRPSRPNG